MNIKQLPSKYLLVEGEHCVEYQLQTTSPYVFTELKLLWEDALGDIKVKLSKDKRTATFVAKVISRADKYTESELQFIFGDVITLPSKIEVPEKFKI